MNNYSMTLIIQLFNINIVYKLASQTAQKLHIFSEYWILVIQNMSWDVRIINVSVRSSFSNN